MKVLYFDCTNGISGDMLLKVLMDLGNCKTEVISLMEDTDFETHMQPKSDTYTHGHTETSCHHEHSHSHAYHRSYGDVKHLMEHSGFTEKSIEYAGNIYKHIAEAEAKVHGETLETVHFHEVGRDQAIKNALGIGRAMEVIAPDRVFTSPVYDGKGTIVCSHGEIPVPVPAVRAMMERSDFVFSQTDVDTEMVTPSGLAGLMGIGAAPIDGKTEEKLTQWISDQRHITAMSEAMGARITGRGGLKAYILEV